jgi:chromosome segregation protein
MAEPTQTGAGTGRILLDRRFSVDRHRAGLSNALFMHLRAIRLNGFKSFADQTELGFDRGVTAVVGPNGCGKSNIADAIRWVLGEQSAKALRGGKMHDVIFSGTDSRKPFSMSEVSLYLAECETDLGSDFNELEITRRISRDGASDYLLNGRICRLKDIQRLFMDTGIGRTSYSIMAQGQIDQVLSSKPEERRAVFEEAAGITKYKSQRRETLNKLALVDTNLSRITDIVTEVSRQIGSLKRQAAKAIRFKKLSHRRRHLELAQVNFKWGDLRSSVKELEDQVTGFEAALNEMQEELERRDRSLGEERAERHGLNERIQEAQQAVFDLRSQREQSLNQAHLAEIRRTSLLERIEQAQQDIVGIDDELSALAEQVDTGVHNRQSQLDVVGSFNSSYQDSSRELEQVDERLNSTEDDRQRRKFRLLEADSTLLRLRNGSANLEVDLKTTEHQIEKLKEGCLEAEAAYDEAEKSLVDFRFQLGEVREKRESLKAAIETARQKVADTLGRFRETQSAIQNLDRQIAQKTARQKLLQQLQERLEGYGEGSKALLQGKLGGQFEGQSFRAVADGIKVDRAHSPAIEAILGSALEAVAVVDEKVAGEILRELRERQIGPGVVRFPAPGDGNGAIGSIPDCIQVARQLVTCPETGPELHPVQALLRHCYVTSDLEAFLSFWRANPDFHFLLVASNDGELVDRRGLIFGGYQRKGTGGILEREIELRETSEDIVADSSKLEALRTESGQLNEALAADESNVENRQREQAEAIQEATRLDTEENNAADALDKLDRQISRLKQEASALEEARSQAAERLDSNNKQMAAAQSESDQFRNGIETVEEQIVALRVERDQKREEVAQSRFELAEKKQRLDLTLRGLSEMGQRRATHEELRRSREREIDTWSEQIEGLVGEEQEQIEKADELASTIVAAEESVSGLRSKLVALEDAIGVEEHEQVFVRDNSDRKREGLNQVQIRLAQQQSQIHFLVEEMNREHQTDVKLVDWRFELWLAERQPEGIRTLEAEVEEGRSGDKNGKHRNGSTPSAPDDVKEISDQPTTEELAAFDSVQWDEVKVEVEALRQRLNAIGPVNLVAIEEYSELKQRYDFLQSQSDDIVSSKEQLLQAIDEINRTSQEQFSSTFEQIRINFIQTFQTLFGGGRSGLELVASDDPLDSGIEIVAQPPGTRLRSVLLLSGGQRTMTAVALLFAIYMVKPSPFCILDELDAPLDESNIGRFTTLLKQFTKNSQFIIITHNKRTIAAAQAIYGVTMEEKGVSKVVSMRFHSGHHDAEMAKLAVAGA